MGLWLSCAGTPKEAHGALAAEKLYQKVLPSVMTLEVEDQGGQKFVGSAVLARANDVALTAWHVVADARSVWAVFADGQRVNWAELAAIARPTPPATTNELGQSTAKMPEAKADARGFAAFKSQLNESAGKSVTVVLQEAARTNTFTLTVK